MLFSADTEFLVPFRLVLFYSLFTVACHAAEDDEPTGKIKRIAGYPIVVVNKATQQISGLKTIKTKIEDYRPEFIAIGKAVNIQSLLELRQKYLLALTDSQGAGAKLAQSEQNIKRMETLYRHGIAAKRRLQEQQAQGQVNRSQVDAARFQARAIISEARLNWGKQLAEWAIATETDQLDAFVSGKNTLLQVTLPANKQLPGDVRIIYVDPSGDRSKAQEAELISMAPQMDSTIQGAGFFFRTQGQRVYIGMSVSAWIPEQKDKASGVIIPKSALIRSMDQAFVYIKTDEDRFSRRMLPHAEPVAGGYFVGDSIKFGEEIVITGGQMLLSEELRGQIPDDDD